MGSAGSPWVVDKDRLLRWWTYMRRGHSTYLVFFISFANFVVIQYRLLVSYVPALSLVFASLTAFAVAFFAVYVPLATIIGWLDYRRLAVPVDATLAAEANPWARDLAKALILALDGRAEEAKAVLRRWAG